MALRHVVIVGAGMGGLSAAAELASAGARVTLCEAAGAPGGKIRQVAPGDAGGTLPGDAGGILRGDAGGILPGDAGGILPGDAGGIDAGPTVFTMRWVFEALFAACGADFAAALELAPCAVLARHVWRPGGALGGGRLDLLADRRAAAAAIGDFAGAAAAAGYQDFCARAGRIHATLRDSFMAAEKPSALGLARRIGLGNPGALLGLSPFQTLWAALGEHFADARLRQLFGRYATYCGCSPFAAPATLMLVAHVEQEGVWLVQGGMARLAGAVAALAAARGAVLRYGAKVAEIRVRRGRAAGVRLADGEEIAADAVIFNGDTAALAAGLLGESARRGGTAMPRAARSLSAVTWCADVPVSDFPLARHSVFFSDDYAAEFAAMFGQRRLPEEPTVYVCAQDRDDAGAVLAAARARGRERLLVLINAPADGDVAALPAGAARAGAARMLAARGFAWPEAGAAEVVTDPAGFAALFPATGGALYGPAGHGAMANFRRGGGVSRVPGLYLAGGSVHPGPGVPMAALSGRLAAARVAQDLSLSP